MSNFKLGQIVTRHAIDANKTCTKRGATWSMCLRSLGGGTAAVLLHYGWDCAYKRFMKFAGTVVEGMFPPPRRTATEKPYVECLSTRLTTGS